MRLLFLIEDFDASSHAWARLMVEMLEDEIVAIACHSPKNKTWNNKIPIINLTPRKSILERIVLKTKHLFHVPTTADENAILLRETIKHYKIDTILINFITFALFYKDCWFSQKLPVFIHCHGSDITWDIRYHDKPDIRIHPNNYIEMVQGLVKKVTFIANSRYTCGKLKEIQIPDDKIKLKYFGTVVSEAPIVREPKEEVHILYLGRLVDCKGPDLVIKAFEKACEKGLKGCLTIAGDGPLMVTCQLLKAKSLYNNKIHFKGEVSEERVKELLFDADIFTTHNCIGRLSKQEEAFGISIIEAMAMALPVVSAKSGGLLETVMDGETGILVEQYNVDKHANALLELSSNHAKRIKMGLNGWKRVKDNFNYPQQKEIFKRILC